MKIAVIVTTYNRPDALAAVIEAYLAQRDRDFEIVVADDGSGPETAATTVDFQKKTDIAIGHVRQEDLGFRAGAIRNRALARTSAEYVIFTDGDCLPLPGFVATHRRLAERGWFVAGNRLLLGERMSRRILADRMPAHDWPMGKWFHAFMEREVNRLVPLWPLPVPGWMRKLPARRWQGVMTCNLAVWRADLLTVNGFDETYEGWGLEDSDLTVRLLHAGCRRKSARFAAPVLHLWHPGYDRGSLVENRRRLDSLLRSEKIRAQQGVDRYL